MSHAMWCDPGGHPYPQGQPGSTTIKLTEQVKNQWGGYQPSDMVHDVCAACAIDLGYSNLETDVSDEENKRRAYDIRGRTGGKRAPTAIGASEAATTEAEKELEGVRLSEIERRLNEIQFPDDKTVRSSDAKLSDYVPTGPDLHSMLAGRPFDRDCVPVDHDRG